MTIFATVWLTYFAIGALLCGASKAVRGDRRPGVMIDDLISIAVWPILIMVGLGQNIMSWFLNRSKSEDTNDDKEIGKTIDALSKFLNK